MSALRAYIDFIYIAQYEVHSTASLSKLRTTLRRFHANKAALVDVGIRNSKRIKGHFKIPKLELMHHVARLIRLNGSAPQHSTEHSERCHMTMAKIPYRATNRKDYGEQICRVLDRQEKLEWFFFYLEWMRTRRDKDAHLTCKVIAVRRRLRFQRVLQRRQSPKIRDYFHVSSRFVMTNETTAIILTTRPFMKNATLHRVAEIYKLNNLLELLSDYATPFQSINTRGWIGNDATDNLDVWDHLRLQLRATQTAELLQPVHISARPPSEKMRFGHCNFVLVRNDPERHIVGIQGLFIGDAIQTNFMTFVILSTGHFVAQIRLIFRVQLKDRQHTLAYIQPFKPASRSTVGRPLRHAADDNIRMFRVCRVLNRDKSRSARLISLSDIWRAVELIPLFRKQCPPHWTSMNSTELADEFYINSFADKEAYQCGF